MAAPGQVEQQGFGSVAGGVARHHVVDTKGGRLAPQTVVAPAAGGRLPAGRLPGLVEQKWQLLGVGPGLQLPGLLGRLGAPAVIAMPQNQLPVVQPAQVGQQHGEGHRILASRYGQQQRRPSGQQLRMAQQVMVQALMVGAPGGWRGLGWENHASTADPVR